jgi:hypothetical protein
MGSGFCAQTGEAMFLAPSTTGEGASRSLASEDGVNLQRACRSVPTPARNRRGGAALAYGAKGFCHAPDQSEPA